MIYQLLLVALLVDYCYCVEDCCLLEARLYWGGEQLLVLEALIDQLAREELGGLVEGKVAVESTEVFADLVDVLELSEEQLWGLSLGGKELLPIFILRIPCSATKLVIFQKINLLHLCNSFQFPAFSY